MDRPLVGVGVIILRHDKILLGRRQGSHGAGSWSAPGGHLEFGETPEECARREVLEETGLILKKVRRGPWVDVLFHEAQKHYITLFMLATAPDGEAQRLEPEKCDGWRWFPLDALPQPLFAPVEKLLREHRLADLIRHGTDSVSG
ncbi:NUDIX domain-containing protein [Erwinia sp. CPCC 100877]|nr:NUDIX domain-containing protein [Erwinia sp. CPCC 100877]